jgi:uncharacterized membrane protein
MSIVAAPVPVKGSTAKLVGFIVFGLLTLFVTVAKNAKVFDPTSDIAQHFAPAKGYLIVHAIFGGLALVLGAFQFSNRLRARYLSVHRKLGYLYVLGVFVSAPFAIPVAMRTGTPVLLAAASTQSLGWMLATAVALVCIKRGNVEQHRRWMIRGYPFAMVFTVARMIIPIPPVLKMGMTGVELVVWVTIALAAILPSLLLDWPGARTRPATS